MKFIKKAWQLAFFIILAAIVFPFLNFTHMTLLEYGVLIFLGINIIVEAVDLCFVLRDEQHKI